ncbi:DUF397 domain-containing protein [Streptomyces yaizuensis]|uniref:DUF397 domain-containing protein n=1 Tax=Streptomyces yaizuensis TaxID=2989713 RepID=A0ABQ5P5I7_9ACTN|nr:DUF397 domain-containing protein [Streptomyces sp. YSPA8]GLF97861.1 DUF397 domain-containing protein [Streptomyces sp. YSPA8]
MSSFDTADAVWVKSSHSGPDGGACVEWAPAHASTTSTIPVRDSKQAHGPILMLSTTAFTGLVTLARTAAR